MNDQSIYSDAAVGHEPSEADLAAQSMARIRRQLGTDNPEADAEAARVAALAQVPLETIKVGLVSDGGVRRHSEEWDGGFDSLRSALQENVDWSQSRQGVAVQFSPEDSARYHRDAERVALQVAMLQNGAGQ